jgi:hypothetical protein
VIVGSGSGSAATCSDFYFGWSFLDFNLNATLCHKVLSASSFHHPSHAMPKRTIGDSDNESHQAGPSTPKRARRASSSPGPRSTSSAESRIRSNESTAGEQSGDDTPNDRASLDLDALEEQIRSHIDATRLANNGRLGVRPFFLFCVLF